MKYYYRQHQSGYQRVRAEGKKAWGEIHGNTECFENFFSRAFLEEALSMLHFSSSTPMALECGCGTGPGACLLAERGFRVDAIDLIPIAIELAGDIARERELDINFEVMDVCAIPHEGVSYDLIVDSYCLQGIVTDADRKKVFASVRARLKPDGYYVASTSMYTPERDHRDEHVTDVATGKTYTRYHHDGLLDRDTEVVYSPFSSFSDLEDQPESYEDAITVNDTWHHPIRRVRTPESLRAELATEGFDMLYQEGEEKENFICVHEGADVTLGEESQ